MNFLQKLNVLKIRFMLDLSIPKKLKSKKNIKRSSTINQSKLIAFSICNVNATTSQLNSFYILHPTKTNILCLYSLISGKIIPE